MAAPQQPIPFAQEQRLSELYLTLWKQLDTVCPEGKWLQIRLADQTELKTTAELILQEFRSRLSPSEPMVGEINKDVMKTQELVSRAGDGDKTELETFKDYLRNNALRWSQLSCGEAATT